MSDLKKKTFIYIKGRPATGKITVARILNERLNYRLFWFHDIKNAVYRIVENHRIPSLMDKITQPIISYLLERSENIVYVRPSSNPKTVEKITSLIEKHGGYEHHIVNLTASYETLVGRVSKRNEKYRISSKKDLDDYINDKPESSEFPGEHTIDTSDVTPEQVVKKIIKQFNLEKNSDE